MPALESAHDAEARSDADLILAIRGGDTSAVDELYRRHHRAALSFAESLAGRVLAPDLVSDAFVRILDLMTRGGGPSVVFRSYLYTTVRNLYIDHVRHHSRQTSLPDFGPLEAELALEDGVDDHFEHSVVKKAFTSLPERWQVALWYTTVEGVSLEDAGTFLGVAPNAVAALTFRAREGLRQAYLAEHLNLTVSATCAEVWDVLPRYVRGTLRDRMRQNVEDHLETCRHCTAAVSELAEVNSNLRGLLLIALLGGAATAGYLERALDTPAPPPAPAPEPAPAAGSATTGVPSAPVARAASGLTRSKRAAVAVGAAAAAGALVLAWPHHDAPRSGSVPAETAPSQSQPHEEAEERSHPGGAAEAHPGPRGGTGATTTAQEATFQQSSASRTLALGRPTWTRLTSSTPSWYHVLVPISAGRARTSDLILRLESSAWDAFHVHRETGYGPWRCSVGKGATLLCSLAVGAAGSPDLGLDVQAEGAVTMNVTVDDGAGHRSTRTFVVGR